MDENWGKKKLILGNSHIFLHYIYIILYVNQYIWCAIYFTMELIHDLNSTSMYIIYIYNLHNYKMFWIAFIRSLGKPQHFTISRSLIGRIWEHTEDNRHIFDDRWTNLTIWNSVIKANNVCFYCHLSGRNTLGWLANAVCDLTWMGVPCGLFFRVGV
jgi:hypothetical protein